MENEKKLEQEKKQYKTMYEIVLEENELLKQRCILLQEEYNRLTGGQDSSPHRSIFYRIARKGYRMIKKIGKVEK